MLQSGYILCAVTACSLVLSAIGYNPRASTPQDLNAETLGGKSMDPFVKVMVCAPVNVKIIPGPEHKLAVTADASVEEALNVKVHEGASTAALPSHGRGQCIRPASTRLCSSQEPCPSRSHKISGHKTQFKSRWLFPTTSSSL